MMSYLTVKMETLQDLVEIISNHGNNPAISWKDRRQIKSISYNELYESIVNYSKGFLEFGLEEGDRVAIFSRNVPEWVQLTLAMNYAGIIDVPRGENATEEEIKHILSHSEAKFVIVEDEALLKLVEKNKPATLEHIFSIKPIDNITNISEIERKGQGSEVKINRLDAETTASIIYTSGTTGMPKGVELTHKNFTSNLCALLNRIEISSDDKALSILPPWHAFERISKYLSLSQGIETFHTTPKSLFKDLKEQRPTIMPSVPRIWEMIYEKVMKQIESEKGLKKKFTNILLSLSLDCAKRRRYDPIRILELPFNYLANKMIFSKVRENLGGNLRFAISGGGALQPHIDDFFNVCGIEILEGYGLTETSPVIAVREPRKKQLHSVGPLIEGVEVKIIEQDTNEACRAGVEGIIHVSGPNVMKGYYKNPEETMKVMQKNWFNTGDCGYFDKLNNLVITGRLKDIIVLSNGENVNPIPLEAKLMQSEYISYAVVVGQDARRLGVLIVPNNKALKDYCQENGVSYSSNVDEIFSYEVVQELYKSEINVLINQKSQFKNYEKIPDFRLLPSEFSIGDELTATLKIRRNYISNKYQTEIDSMNR